jgi:hypothetical protein
MPISSQNERRTIFYRLLDTQSSNVVQLLASFFQLAGSSTSMQSKVFRCLLSWLRHSSMLTTAVGTQAVSAQLSSLLGGPTPSNIRDIFLQMISFAFDALPSEELFETAVDVICEAIRQSSIDIDRTETRGAGEVKQLTLSNVAQMLLHKVLVLRDQQLNGVLKNHSVAEGHVLTGDDDIDMVKVQLRYSFCFLLSPFCLSSPLYFLPSSLLSQFDSLNSTGSLSHFRRVWRVLCGSDCTRKSRSIRCC